MATRPKPISTAIGRWERVCASAGGRSATVDVAAAGGIGCGASGGAAGCAAAVTGALDGGTTTVGSSIGMVGSTVGFETELGDRIWVRSQPPGCGGRWSGIGAAAG